MSQKRAKEIVILGWLIIAFASYVFYRSVLILGDFLMLPLSFMDIMRAEGNLKIIFLSTIFAQIFSILLFIAGIGILYSKRCSVILLILFFILDFSKRIYVMAVLGIIFNAVFAAEIILSLLVIYCLCQKRIRQALG